MPRGERPWIVYTFGKTVPAMRTGNWPFRLCTSLASRLMIVVFGLGTRLRVRMRTKLENGVLSNGQQPQCCKRLLLARVNLKRDGDAEWLGSCIL